MSVRNFVLANILFEGKCEVKFSQWYNIYKLVIVKIYLLLILLAWLVIGGSDVYSLNLKRHLLHMVSL